MRSDTAFFSAADISRRFLAGLASDLLSAAAAAFVGEEERRDVERAGGADAPRICSTSVNALISAWRRSIALWRLAIACAIELMALESSDPAMGMSTRGGGRRGSPRPAGEVVVPFALESCTCLTSTFRERPVRRPNAPTPAPPTRRAERLPRAPRLRRGGRALGARIP